jgi:endonuclease/exonuclease/phosphatase family metal-dependent hydrolase
MMKTLVLFFCILIASTNLYAQENAFNIATFNIRLDTPRDSINQWENRKQWVWQTIAFYELEIVGMQEVFHHQLMYLLEQDKRYKHVGVGRDDGKSAGEYSPIIFNSERFEVLDSNTFWLSETPEKPGLGWDAKYNRVVSWAKFKDLKTKQIFFVFNTHFDHVAEKARRESAKLLHKKMGLLAGNYPVVVMGDFNASLDSEPMRIMLSSEHKHELKNSIDLSQTPHFGPFGTFNGFGYKETSDSAIDHILVNDKIRVLKHASLSNTWQGRFASDHFAVMSLIELKN